MRKGSRAALEGAAREQEGALWDSAGAQQVVPELAALYPAIAARVIYDVRQHCCLAQPPAA